MDWKKERDALIEQTFAFVQSVTGRIEETAKRGAASARPVPPPPETSAAPVETTPTEAAPVEAAIIQSLPLETAGPADSAPAASPVEPIEALQSAASPTPTFQSGVKDEIQARIASFRAHQDRFGRERAEYCSTTLRRLRATIDAPARAGQISEPNGSPGRISSSRPATDA